MELLKYFSFTILLLIFVTQTGVSSLQELEDNMSTLDNVHLEKQERIELSNKNENKRSDVTPQPKDSNEIEKAAATDTNKEVTPTVVFTITPEPSIVKPSTTLPTIKTTKPKVTTPIPLTTKPVCNCDERVLLTVHPKLATIVEGSDLDVSCQVNNIPSNSNWTLQWIHNSHVPNQVKKSTEINVLEINKANKTQAGVYTCLASTYDGCCQLEAYNLINVYQKPNYSLHLMIVSLVCLAQVILCLPLIIYQHKRIKKLLKDIENDEKSLII